MKSAAAALWVAASLGWAPSAHGQSFYLEDAESISEVIRQCEEETGWSAGVGVALDSGLQLVHNFTLADDNTTLIPYISAEPRSIAEKLRGRVERIDPPPTRRGLWAIKNASLGEVLWRIPYRLIVRGEQKPTLTSSGYDNTCTTIKRLRDLFMMIGRSGYHKVYLRSLPKIGSLNVLPQGWSEADRALLGSWFWDEHPTNLINDFEKSCNGKMTADGVSRRAALTFASRNMKHSNTGYMLVPILDQANHARGSRANIYGELAADSFVVKAKRDIVVGEELLMDYLPKEGLTGELFSNYGIVDALPPQNWTVPGVVATGDGPKPLSFVVNEDGTASWPKWQQQLEDWSFDKFRAAASKRLEVLRAEDAAPLDPAVNETLVASAKAFRASYMQALEVALEYSSNDVPKSPTYPNGFHPMNILKRLKNKGKQKRASHWSAA